MTFAVNFFLICQQITKLFSKAFSCGSGRQLSLLDLSKNVSQKITGYKIITFYQHCISTNLNRATNHYMQVSLRMGG